MTIEDLYGLNTRNVRAKSVLEQIQTCKHPRQLEYMTKWILQNVEHPSQRTYKRWLRALKSKQEELGCQVLIFDEEAGGDRAHGG